jgi:hypothetical protein
MNSIRSFLSRNYPIWSLYLSGYAPLLIIFALRLIGKNHPVKAAASTILASLLIGNAYLSYRLMRSGPEDYVAKQVDSRTSDVAAFVATYLLPFAVVSDVTCWDLGAYAAFVYIVGLVCVRGDYIYINPLLALFGYRAYQITTGADRVWMLLSKDRIYANTAITARSVAYRFLILEEVKANIHGTEIEPD